LVRKTYLFNHTRLDIAYAVSVVNHFMHDLRERHMQEVDKSSGLGVKPRKGGLFFKKGDTLTLKIYTNADYEGFVIDRKSTSRHHVFLGEI